MVNNIPKCLVSNTKWTTFVLEISSHFVPHSELLGGTSKIDNRINKTNSYETFFRRPVQQGSGV